VTPSMKASRRGGQYVTDTFLYGRLILQFEDNEVALNPGDFYVVPKGTLHNPVAEEECGIVLIETVTTRHTRDVDTPLTRSIEEQLPVV